MNSQHRYIGPGVLLWTFLIGALLLIVLLMAPLVAGAQALSDNDVTAALALADQKPQDYVAQSNPGLYDVYVFGRLGRIAYAAAEAKRAYLPFTLSDELRRDEVRVLVTADTPVFNRWTGYAVAPPITRVVLRAKDGTVTQPLDMTLEPKSWSNALGGVLAGHDATVRFPALPDGDFDVVLITVAGEDVYKIKGKNRQKIR